MHATIQDCSLRDDGNIYPAFPPKCDECKNFRSFADVKKQMLGDYVEVVRCKDCQWCYECAGGELRCENSYERNNMDRTVTADFFCADGERK